MCLPGGGSMARENIEGREMLGNATYSGVVSFWSWSSGWGHIKPNPGQSLPIKVRQKIAEAMAEVKKKAKPGVTPEEILYFNKEDCAKGFYRPNKDTKVKFKVYSDSKGVGACEIIEDA